MKIKSLFKDYKLPEEFLSAVDSLGEMVFECLDTGHHYKIMKGRLTKGPEIKIKTFTENKIPAIWRGYGVQRNKI